MTKDKNDRDENLADNPTEVARRPSYKDTFWGQPSTAYIEIDASNDDEEVSHDDKVAEMKESAWFSMGVTRQEKIEVRKSRRNNLIIKLVERRIEYQFLFKRLQAIWRIQSPFNLVDLPNDFFIVRFTSKDDYATHYLMGHG